MPDQEGDIIKIDLSDIDPEPRIKFGEEPTLTENQKRAINLSEEAAAHFSNQMATANTEAEYLSGHQGHDMYDTPNKVEWMFEYGDVDLEGLIAEMAEPRFEAITQRDVRMLNKLKEEISKLPPREGFLRIAISKIRDKVSQDTIGYAVLAAFPDGFPVSHLGFDPDAVHQNEGAQTVFFKPQNACTEHACSDLLSSFKSADGRSCGYMPTMSLYEAINTLKSEGGVIEYMLDKTESGVKITQSTHSMLTTALLGGFGNETCRVRISDFWKKRGLPLP